MKILEIIIYFSHTIYYNFESGYKATLLMAGHLWIVNSWKYVSERKF